MITYDIKFLIILGGILILILGLSPPQQYSTGQESANHFMLSCDNITSQVNQLLESKGPVQRNLLDLKNMTFMMSLYSIKCG